jgi:predicted phage terminase large subunit-like protein
VENAAMGPELINAARRKVQGVIPVNADRDKVSRAYAVTPQLEAGHIYVPGQARMTSSGFAPDPGGTPAFVQELIAECAAFPNATHDDQVDTLTQALDPRRWNTQRPSSARRQRSVTGGYSRGNV